MKETSIASKAARGAGWLLAWRVATRTIGFLSTLVLARLLKPSDFGVLTLGMVLANAVDAMSFIGVWDQLVRTPDLRRELLDTAFTLNLARNVLTSAVLAGCCFFLAASFHDSRLVPVTLAIAFNTLLNGFWNVGLVEFQRSFAFEKEFQLAVVPRLISVAATITAAFVLRDYRALIVGIISGQSASVLCGYVIHPYRPRLGLGAWRELISFSLWSWAYAVTNFLKNRSDTLLIGRLLGTGLVGVYSVALEVATLPFSELIDPIGRALFSGFAAARIGGSTGASEYVRALGVICLILLPATVGVSILAAPLTELMFGKSWMAAIPLIQILALGGTLRVCSQVGNNLLTAFGWPSVTFRINLISTFIRLPAMIWLTMRFGLIGCAYAVLVSIAVEEAFYLVVTARRCQVRFASVLSQVWRPVIASAVMAAILVLCERWWLPAGHDNATLLRALCLAVPGGAAVFTGTLLGLWIAAGAPAGAETELLGLARNAILSVRSRLARSTAPTISPGLE